VSGPIKKEKMFCDLLRLSALRGPHSTGVAFTGINGAAGVVKAPVLPDVLMEQDDFKTITRKGWYNCYMGHNRWATMGKINEKNAHPFDFETLIGCHNGTLHSRFDLNDGHLFDTDSETIFHNINKKGLRETYKKLRGAVALVWWGKQRKTLNFIRNQHRPLVYAWTKNKDGIIWASEGWMIDVAAKRNKIEHGKIFDTGIHKHYEITFQNKKITIKKKKIKPFVAPPYVAPKDFFNGLQRADGYIPFGAPHSGSNNPDYGQSYPNNVHEEEEPKVGNVYSLYPRNIITSYRKKKIDRITIVCGFQSLHKKFVAKIQIFNKKDFYLAELYPGLETSKYSKLFYKGRISHAYHSGKKKEAKVFIVQLGSIDVIVPRDCKRSVRKGMMMDREMFDAHYKDCGYCGDPLCFEDDYIEFSEKEDDLAICGKCSESFDMAKEGL